MPFLVLPENRFAHTAVEALVSAADQARHAPVFLHGPSGSGKTLLVKQAAAAFRRNHRNSVVLIVNAADFASQRDAAPDCIPWETIEAADATLIVFEDVQSLEGRTDSQRRMLAAGDELLGSGGRVIWTATQPPGELRGFLGRLTSRFRAGVLAPLKNPGRASRLHLLEQFAADQKARLPDDALRILAERLKNATPSELQAALKQLKALSRHAHREIDVEMVQRHLADDVPLPEPSIEQITRQVARQFGVTVAAIRSQKRARELVIPRQIAMFLARRQTNRPVKQIGWYFGRRSHTTVLHACARISRLVPEQPDLQNHLTRIQTALGRQNTTDD